MDVSYTITSSCEIMKFKKTAHVKSCGKSKVTYDNVERTVLSYGIKCISIAITHSFGNLSTISMTDPAEYADELTFGRSR